MPIRHYDRLAKSILFHLTSADGPCLKVKGGEWIEYPDVAWKARSLQTHWLQDQRLPRGSLVLILCENGPECVISDFACVFAGLVSVPVAVSVTPSQLAAILPHTSVTCAVCTWKQVPLLLSALKHSEYKKLEEIVIAAPASNIRDSPECQELREYCPTINSWFDLVLLEKGQCLPMRPSEFTSSTVLLTFSSGSTGTPKAATMSDKSLNREWNHGNCAPIHIFAYEPLAYSSQRLLLYDSITSGGRTVFFSGDMTSFFEELRDAAPNQFFAPPRIWNLLYAIYKAKISKSSEEGATEAKSKAIREIRSYLGPNITSISTGGAPISSQVWDWMNECFSNIPVSEGYGATEAGSIARNGVRTYTCLVHLDDVPELGYDSSTRPVAKGLLWVRTPQLSDGYYNDASATEANFAERDDIDGRTWYNTGDIVQYNHDTQELRVIDRLSNITKLAQSVYVSPEHLENVYIASPFVESIYVYAEPSLEHVLAVILPNIPVLFDTANRCGIDLPSSDEGDNLVFLCEHEQIVSEVVESLKTVAKEKGLLPHEIPPKVLLEPERWSVESGLLTVSHKIARIPMRLKYSSRLQELYGKDKLEETTSVSPSSCSKMELVLREILPSSSLACKDRTLSELGIDSVSILQIQTILESHFGVFDVSLLFSTPLAELLALDPSKLQRKKKESFDSDLVLDPSFTHFPSVPLTEEPNDKSQFTIFLTGATGFVGSQILHDILLRFPLSTVVCLVQQRPGKTSESRLLETLECYKLKVDMSRVKVVEGTLSTEYFGLPESEFNALSESLDFIVHAGCWVNGVLKYHALRGPNVLGTKECLKLAYRCKKLQKFCYVSSLSVVEFHNGNKLSEVDFPSVEKNRLTLGKGYGITKCVSEMLVRQAYAKGLPACMIRPGTICANTKTGVNNPNDIITKYFQAIVQLQKAPKLPHHFVSLVSVDYVSSITLASTFFPSPPTDILPTFHCVGSSRSNIFSVSAITKCAQMAGRQVEEIDFVSWRDLVMNENDPKKCALVPIKLYFSGREFPLGVDPGEDKRTQEFFRNHNTAFSERFTLSEDTVSLFFSV